MFGGWRVAMVSQQNLDGVPMLSGAYRCIRPGQIARTVCADQNVVSDL